MNINFWKKNEGGNGNGSEAATAELDTPRHTKPIRPITPNAPRGDYSGRNSSIQVINESVAACRRR
jgi:hypothetical protein